MKAKGNKRLAKDRKPLQPIDTNTIGNENKTQTKKNTTTTTNKRKKETTASLTPGTDMIDAEKEEKARGRGRPKGKKAGVGEGEGVTTKKTTKTKQTASTFSTTTTATSSTRITSNNFVSKPLFSPPSPPSPLRYLSGTALPYTSTTTTTTTNKNKKNKSKEGFAVGGLDELYSSDECESIKLETRSSPKKRLSKENKTSQQVICIV